MSSINSLINPPDEAGPEEPGIKTEIETEAQPKIKTEAQSEIKTEAQPEIKADTEIKDEDKKTTVSQETILNSFDKIKTHFPAARIKKIMQSDEDIGKVAQATPVVVGRALEIFMANLVEAAIIEAKGAGVRRIAASHVRAAVEDTEQFDFLVDVVLKYPSSRH